jgi:hypothetical protein
MNFYRTKALENDPNDEPLQDIFAPKSSGGMNFVPHFAPNSIPTNPTCALRKSTIQPQLIS